jgi:hypothetical protein
MVFIENEGALFRGFSRSHPQQVWDPESGWQAYTGSVPKGWHCEHAKTAVAHGGEYWPEPGRRLLLGLNDFRRRHRLHVRVGATDG